MTKHYSKTPSNRQLQVGQQIRSALFEFLSCGEYFHPILESTIITVSEVRISPDLKIATAFIVLPSDSDRKLILSFLKDIAPEARKFINTKLNLRFSPEIRFVNDDTAEREDRVESLFIKIKY